MAQQVESTPELGFYPWRRERKKVFRVHCRGWKSDMIGPSVKLLCSFYYYDFPRGYHTTCRMRDNKAQGDVIPPLFASF